ncbi:MAG: MBL fold metallo-hydrolase [Pseudomonadota bacterium]
MSARYSVLVTGNALRLRDDFLGISSVVLVETAGQRWLIDAGGPVTRGSLKRALRDRGLGPGDIDAIFLSHLHFDHAWNLDLFPHARLHVSAAELAYAADPHPEDDLIPEGLLERLSARGVEVLEGEGVLAPGLTVLPAPGHTPGLYAAEVATAAGPVLLACDAIKYPKEVMSRRCDLAFDAIETGTATIARLLERAERIVPGHAPEMHRTAEGWTWDSAAEFPLMVR